MCVWCFVALGNRIMYPDGGWWICWLVGGCLCLGCDHISLILVIQFTHYFSQPLSYHPSFGYIQHWTFASGEVFSFPTEFCCVRSMLIAQQLFSLYSFLIIVCCAIIFALNTSHSLFLFKYSLGQNIPGYGWIKLAYSCWSNLLYWICFFLRFRERNSYK